jgi:hypothetical protein
VRGCSACASASPAYLGRFNRLKLSDKLQDFPGHGCTLNSAGYVRSVLDVLLQQQRLDYEHLHGSRGMDKCVGIACCCGVFALNEIYYLRPISNIALIDVRFDPPPFLVLTRSVARGCLQHTVSLAVYMLPPAGPGALDLLLMSMLAKHTSVVPVLSQVGASDEAALQRTRELLAKPEALVPGLEGSFPTLACVLRHIAVYCCCVCVAQPLPLSLRWRCASFTSQCMCLCLWPEQLMSNYC